MPIRLESVAVLLLLFSYCVSFFIYISAYLYRWFDFFTLIISVYVILKENYVNTFFFLLLFLQCGIFRLLELSDKKTSEK